MIEPKHVLVVEARFYEDLADDLAAGAGAVLDAAGVPFERVAVPGSFELPAAIRFAIGDQPGTGRYAGAVALGCVIRGETDHYDHICREVSRALMDLSIERCLPLGFGVLTCATYEQARVRAAAGGKNKGADAARACLSMIELRRRLALASE
jgi:6,7-dimethyl-8-ribityllumazine synthase